MNEISETQNSLNGFYQCVHPMWIEVDRRNHFEMSTNSVFAVLQSNIVQTGKQTRFNLRIFYNAKTVDISCHKNYFEHRCRLVA